MSAALLDGRAGVVTGGARGIGLAIGRRLLSEGARVVLADIDPAAAQAAAEQLGGELAHTDRDARVAGVACDVTSADEVAAAVSTCVERFGSLDVMVNNAGITRDATLRRMSPDDFDLVIAVHLRGTWNGVRAAAAVMREQQRGSIVNISSISGKVGMVGQTNYSAAKAGIIGLTKAAAKELGHLGVRVNAVQPGIVLTDMTAALREDVWAAKLAEVPMGRAAEASEVAGPVLFLASEMSSYITGAVLEVTGGRFL